MSMFHCHGCGEELVDHEDVEYEDEVECDECDLEYVIGKNEHPSFDVALYKKQ